MKKLLLVSLNFCWCLCLNAQYLTNQGFEKQYGDLLDAEYFGNISTVDNHLYQVAHKNIPGQASDIFLKKTHIDGSDVWEATYTNSGVTEDHGIDLLVDASGNVFTIGALYDDVSNSYDAIIIKYNSSGVYQWHSTYSSAGVKDDIPTALCQDGTGNTYITGQTKTSEGTGDVFVHQVSSSGAAQWSATYDYQSNDDGGVGISFESSQVVVLAITQGTNNRYELSKVIYNSSGAQQSTARTNIANDDLLLADIVKDGAGGYLLAGSSKNVNGDHDLSVYSVNSALTTSWSYTLDHDGHNDHASTLVQDGTGNIYSAGNVETANNQHFAIVKLSSTGTELKKFIGDNYDNSTAIDLCRAGDKILTSVQLNQTSVSALGLLFDSDLESVWNKKITGSNQQIAPTKCIALGAESFVFESIVRETAQPVQLQLQRFDLFDENVTTVTNEDGYGVVQNQIVVKIWPDLVNTDFTDNEDLEFAFLKDVVTTSTFNWLNDTLDTFTWDSVKVRKVFKSFTSTDVSIVGNHNYPIDLPALYTNFVLYFNEDINEVATAAALDSKDNIFVFAEIDEVGVLHWKPNDSKINLQPSLVANNTITDAHIGMEEAWNIEKGKDFVRVAVFDSGILWNHEDFSKNGSKKKDYSKVVAGYSMNKNKDLFELKMRQTDNQNNGHGTSMSGVIGAISNNSMGVAGIAGGDAANNEFGVSLVAMQWNASSPGGTSKSKVAEYIVKGAKGGDLHYHVANHSWSGGQSKALAQGVYTAFLTGAIQSCSAGNDDNEKKNCYPADYDDDLVLQVGNSNANKERSSSSDFGFDLDFMAPGQPALIHSTHIFEGPQYYFSSPPTNEYKFTDGTSAAAAHVSGAAALLVSNWNSTTKNAQNLVQEDVEYLLEIGAEDMEYQKPGENAGAGYDKFSGWGLVKADKSLQYIQTPNYDLKHIITTASGSHVTKIGTDVEIEVKTDDCYTDLKPDKYIADVYKVQLSTSHNWSSAYSINNHSSDHPGFWMLNSVSNLWDYDEDDKTTTARNGVKFTSTGEPSSSGATLFGYFFYVKEKKRRISNKTINTWYPHKNTDNHVLAYSVHLSRGWNLGTEEQQSQFALYPNPATQVLNIKATANNDVIKSINIIGLNGQVVDRIVGINASEYQYQNTSRLKGMYLVAIQSRKSQYHAKVRFQ